MAYDFFLNSFCDSPCVRMFFHANEANNAPSSFMRNSLLWAIPDSSHDGFTLSKWIEKNNIAVLMV